MGESSISCPDWSARLPDQPARQTGIIGPAATESLAAKTARWLFVLYAMFMLLGAGPLSDGDEVSDVTLSNPINQIVDSVLPVLAVLCLLPRRRQLWQLVRREKFLTLFLVWSVITVVWSDFSLSSGKAAVRLAGGAIVIVSFLLNTESPDEAIPYLRRIFSVYVPLSFLVVAFVPRGIQWEFPAWRGLADGKNTLGQIAVISAFFWVVGFRKLSRAQQAVAALFLAGSCILLAGSKSTTGLVAFLLLSALAAYSAIEQLMRRLGVARVTTFAAAVSLVMVLVLVSPFDLAAATNVFGKDDTFTGRTDVWASVIDEALQHPYLGAGFAGFWIPENPAVERLWQDDKFPWRPNEGHEGYLDIWNETGLVGVSILALLVLSYFNSWLRLKRPHVWQWLFLAVLVFNLTESIIFRVGQFSGWMFLFSYLALQKEGLQEHARKPSGRMAAKSER